MWEWRKRKKYKVSIYSRENNGEVSVKTKEFCRVLFCLTLGWALTSETVVTDMTSVKQRLVVPEEESQCLWGWSEGSCPHVGVWKGGHLPNLMTNGIGENVRMYVNLYIVNCENYILPNTSYFLKAVKYVIMVLSSNYFKNWITVTYLTVTAISLHSHVLRFKIC